MRVVVREGVGEDGMRLGERMRVELKTEVREAMGGVVLVERSVVVAVRVEVRIVAGDEGRDGVRVEVWAGRALMKVEVRIEVRAGVRVVVRTEVGVAVWVGVKVGVMVGERA